LTNTEKVFKDELSGLLFSTAPRLHGLLWQAET
jgi:hypothetical protein